MPTILSLLSSWKLVLAAALLAGACGVTWYVTHGMDQRAYVTLQNKQANLVIAQQKADQAALDKLRAARVAAGTAADTAFSQTADAAQKTQTKLVAAMPPTAHTETQHAPSFALCAPVAVPDGVRQYLAN